MCGRFTLRTSPAEIAEAFALLREPETVPRYNVAPTQLIAVIRQVPAGRELSAMHWGLIPPWAAEPKMGGRLINARAETVAASRHSARFPETSLPDPRRRLF